MSKYGAFSGPYFPLFSPNAGKYGREKTLYFDTFHAVPQKDYQYSPTTLFHIFDKSVDSLKPFVVSINLIVALIILK